MPPINRNQNGPSAASSSSTATPRATAAHRDADKERLADTLAQSQSSFEYGSDFDRHYKSLYERECQENKLLRRRIEELSLKATETTSASSRTRFPPMVNGGGVHGSNGTNGPVKEEERKHFERRIAALEYELEVGDGYWLLFPPSSL